MSFRKIGLAASATSLVFAGYLVACVGDNVTNVVASIDAATGSQNDGSLTSPTDSGAPAQDSGTQPGTDGGTATDAAIADSGVDAGPTASPACQDYCAAMVSGSCAGTAPPDGYPDLQTCLGMCATMPEAGVNIDSIQCRLGYIPSDCVAAGAFGADYDNSRFCGADTPCTAACLAASPKCDAVDASFGANCKTMCDNIAGFDIMSRTCIETETQNMYIDASAGAVAAACKAWTKCQQ